MRNEIKYLLISALLFAISYACKTYYFRDDYTDANALIHSSEMKSRPFLKAHLKNGDVCILKNSWSIDTINNLVTGTGSRYDFNRRQISNGTLSINIDSVAIFETNKPIYKAESSRVAALTILSVVNAVAGIICITNPKACYGSCPTFYLNKNNNFHYADAEGYSSSISPVMKKSDIDAIGQIKVSNDTFTITMKNEALETHCTESVTLLACPVDSGETVFQSPGDKFFLCNKVIEPSSASCDGHNILPELKKADYSEWFSFSDGNDMAAKEDVILEFGETPGVQAGFVLHFRQTMMTTYLIYNAIAYMGDQAGDMFARLETDPEAVKKLENGMLRKLGGIEVYSWNDNRNEWEYENEFFETGPIAINKQMISLKSGNVRKLKLRLNRGLWRIDYAALAEVMKEVKPVCINPTVVLKKGKQDDTALNALITDGKPFITYPGNEYDLKYTLNKNGNYEMFLCSTGYYIEWMRDYWMKEKNLYELRLMVEEPGIYLKKHAAEYKKYETRMEKDFWDSRIDTKYYSFYED